ncbi:MAG: transketolase family protein [Spirochaetes bacterium]|nr:MAG: transketolase family protein [Spirochaetota bacterium]
MNFRSHTPVRDAFGKALLELGNSNPDVVVLTADLTEAIRVHWFAKAFPHRFFQMGISENDMIGTAAGLALAGKIPFVTTFAVFATSLANLPVRLSVGYNQANVKIAASHGGITVGGDGASHQSFDDLALMRMIPGMTVVAPSDATEAYKATLAIAEHKGPVYMRLGRIPTPLITTPESPFNLGKAQVLRAGSDVAIFSIGTMLSITIEAAQTLETKGVSARVINIHTLKPLDSDVILEAARECGCLVTVEEHTILGGLGGAVSEVISCNYPVPIEMVGIKDTFGESGGPEEILKKYGLTARNVVKACYKVIERKRNRA